MKNNIISSIILCILFSCISFGEGSCPQWNKNSPCTCADTKTGVIVHCSGTSESHRVFEILSDMQETSPWELQLDSLSIGELPPSVASVSSLRISNSNIQRLQKLKTTTWTNLNEMILESVQLQDSLWPQIAGARSLKYIKVSDVVIPTIGQEFRNSLSSSVEYIELRKTSTSKIEPHAMSHLSNLRYVFITDIPLDRFPRNILQTTMSQLHTFVLGNTHIEKLEANFFQGMPKLQVLMLNGNRFSNLEAHLFMPLENHLNHLLAERNPLQCNCNLLWLKSFQKRRSINIFATCYDVNTEQVKEIIDLQTKDYCF